MTFNTTTLPLAQALNARRLVERPPRRRHEGFDDIRFVLVTPDIGELLDGRPPHPTLAVGGTDNLIADYCAGWRVTVAKRRPKTNREKKRWRPDFERLDLKNYEEIWALCSRKKKPGWRILGRFVEPGVIVLVKAWAKESLSNNYEKEAKAVIDEWTAILGSLPPFSAQNIEAYFRGNVKDVDENA